MIRVYTEPSQLSDFQIERLPPMPLPTSVLMCAPDYFDVIDIKNPFMAGQIGRVDKKKATQQWQDLKKCFTSTGLRVELIPPLSGREDMVFCANQTFPGLDASGRKVCILSRMKFPSRQKEVPAFGKWFADHGYLVEELDFKGISFEGGGDALWHMGRRLIWGGIGRRSDAPIYAKLAERFQVPVMALRLSTDEFYHLDTCFCLLDEQSVLIYPQAFEPQSLALIKKIFPTVIEASTPEAVDGMACNAAAFKGRTVVIQRGAKKVVSQMAALGFKVLEVDTSEFMKSGGSVFCMKMCFF